MGVIFILTETITIIVLLLLAYVVLRFLFRYGGSILSIILHLASGWIILYIVNLIPGFYVPINLITILISGFGGILGTIVLVLLSFLGIYL